MSLHKFARETVYSVKPGTTVFDAAKYMEKKNVGCVVVAQEHKPIGILTDRDIMLRVVNAGRDAHNTVVEEAMTANPVTLDEDLGLFESLEIMKDKGVRRFPVVDAQGNLSGFFSLDDVLYLLGVEMSAIARIIEQEGA